MESNCVFCKIIGGEIPSEIIYQDERMILIRDIEPKARLHYLAIPKRHYKLLADMTESDRENLKEIFRTVSEHAAEWGLSGGYRVVINQGDDAGQTVPHLHIHLLGGQTLDFPDLHEKQ